MFEVRMRRLFTALLACALAVLAYGSGPLVCTAWAEEAAEMDDVELTATELSHWNRLWGNDRYDTMAAIAREGYAQSDWAVVASGEAFPDALVASSLAGLKRCPIILTSKAGLSAQAAQELSRLETRDAFVIGGGAAVSDDAVSAMGNQLGISSTRVWGSDRQATSVEAFRTLREATEFDTVVIASGQQFPDALSIAPWCYRNVAPILLTGSDKCLSGEQIDEVHAQSSIARIVIVGGPNAVSPQVREQLGEDAYEYVTLAGNDRYETSDLIASWELGQGMGIAQLSVASGDKFPDALAGSSLCGLFNSVLVLVPSNATNTRALDEAVRQKGWSQIECGHVLGGTQAVSEDVYRHCRFLTGEVSEQDPTPQPEPQPQPQPNPNPDTGEMVLITPTGKRYHRLSGCRSTANANTSAVTLEYALSRGLTPCANCYH